MRPAEASTRRRQLHALFLRFRIVLKSFGTRFHVHLAIGTRPTPKPTHRRKPAKR
jgi:hypothetical protein